MGAIMAIGVAVANAILLVTFAEQHRRDEGADARPGRRRRRAGPAAADPDDQLRHDRRHGADGAGLGEGGEQTAPLGRAVIGGLVAATLATLIVLPTVFALVQGRAGRESASLDPDDPASAHYHEEEAEASARRGRRPTASRGVLHAPGHGGRSPAVDEPRSRS